VLIKVGALLIGLTPRTFRARAVNGEDRGRENPERTPTVLKTVWVGLGGGGGVGTLKKLLPGAGCGSK